MTRDKIIPISTFGTVPEKYREMQLLYPLAWQRYLRKLQKRLDYFSIPEPNSGCLLWIGPATGNRADRPDQAYGYVGAFGTKWRVHRLTWYLHTGEELHPLINVLHSCNTPLCRNFTHLLKGTEWENMQHRRRHQFSRGQY